MSISHKFFLITIIFVGCGGPTGDDFCPDETEKPEIEDVIQSPFCSSAFPCNSEEFCWSETGTCLPVSTQGSTCLDTSWCESGTECLAGRCRHPHVCADDQDCYPVAFCDFQTWRCQPKRPNFEECTEDRQCTLGSHCANFVCTDLKCL